jgi:hypothetical protein
MAARKTLPAIFAVARSPVLTLGEKALWNLYRSYDSGKGDGCYIADATAAQHLGKGTRQVQEYRAGLMRKGYLHQRLRGPATACYFAVLPGDAPQAAPPAEKPAPAPPPPSPPPASPDAVPLPMDWRPNFSHKFIAEQRRLNLNHWAEVFRDAMRNCVSKDWDSVFAKELNGLPPD